MAPFTIAVSDSALADLETRLGETHFPAMEVPDLLATDIRGFYDAIR